MPICCHSNAKNTWTSYDVTNPRICLDATSAAATKAPAKQMEALCFTSIITLPKNLSNPRENALRPVASTIFVTASNAPATAAASTANSKPPTSITLAIASRNLPTSIGRDAIAAPSSESAPSRQRRPPEEATSLMRPCCSDQKPHPWADATAAATVSRSDRDTDGHLVDGSSVFQTRTIWPPDR